LKNKHIAIFNYINNQLTNKTNLMPRPFYYTLNRTGPGTQPDGASAAAGWNLQKQFDKNIVDSHEHSTTSNKLQRTKIESLNLYQDIECEESVFDFLIELTYWKFI
jgi:hypothetical protein